MSLVDGGIFLNKDASSFRLQLPWKANGVRLRSTAALVAVRSKSALESRVYSAGGATDLESLGDALRVSLPKGHHVRR